MKLIIEVEKDYYEMIKYNVEHGQEYKPFEIIANGIPYEERPQGEWGWSGSNGNGRNYYNCSICGRLIEAKRDELVNFPYCHCGAQMKEQEKLAYEK